MRIPSAIVGGVGVVHREGRALGLVALLDAVGIEALAEPVARGAQHLGPRVAGAPEAPRRETRDDDRRGLVAGGRSEGAVFALERLDEADRSLGDRSVLLAGIGEQAQALERPGEARVRAVLGQRAADETAHRWREGRERSVARLKSAQSLDPGRDGLGLQRHVGAQDRERVAVLAHEAEAALERTRCALLQRGRVGRRPALSALIAAAEEDQVVAAHRASSTRSRSPVR